MNVQTTATQQKLSKGPGDMPNRGGAKPHVQSSSTTSPLGRKENPVAALGAKPRMGQVQSTNEQCKLSRNAVSPYGDRSATTPEVPLSGKRGRK